MANRDDLVEIPRQDLVYLVKTLDAAMLEIEALMLDEDYTSESLVLELDDAIVMISDYLKQ